MTSPGSGSAPVGPHGPGRLAGLDGLRAVSIALVMLSHLQGTAGFPLGGRALGAAGDLGYFGVRFFFVISGYLITRLLIVEHDRTGTISLRGFYLRRAYRILPAFVAFVGAMILADQLGAVALRERDLVHALTFTTNYHYDRSWQLGHIWSLSVEEQFYLVWPALVLLVAPRRIPHAALVMLALAPVLRALAWEWAPMADDVVMEAYPCVMDAIAAGCLLAWVRVRPGAPRTPPPWGWGVVALVGIAASQVQTDHVVIDYVVDPTVMNLCMAVLVDQLVSRPTGRATRILELRPLVWIGGLSYSLYLWQQPFLNHQTATTTAQWPLNLVLALGCALGSYYLIEQPFLRLRARLRARG